MKYLAGLTFAILLSSTAAFGQATTNGGNTTNNDIDGGSAIGIGNELTQQGQIQGQSQNQTQDLKNTNDNRDTNLNSDFSSNENRNSASAQTGNQANSQSSNSGANNSTSVDASSHYQRNTPSAIAPNVTVYSDDTCEKPVSAGASGAPFSLSFGLTYTDENCIRLKNSRRLGELGFNTAAVALMCKNAEVAEAMANTGTPCTAIPQLAGNARIYEPVRTVELIKMQPVYSPGDNRKR